MEKQQTNQLVLVSVVNSPHGIAGAMSAECLSDNPRRFIPGSQLLGEDGHTYTVESASTHKGKLLLRLVGITTRDSAEKLKGLHLYVAEQASPPLPDGEYYHYQLVGLTVLENERKLGQISEILDYRANDIFVVKDDTGRELLIPAIKEIVKSVDLAKGLMQVVLPEGLA